MPASAQLCRRAAGGPERDVISMSRPSLEIPVDGAVDTQSIQRAIL